MKISPRMQRAGWRFCKALLAAILPNAVIALQDPKATPYTAGVSIAIAAILFAEKWLQNDQAALPAEAAPAEVPPHG